MGLFADFFFISQYILALPSKSVGTELIVLIVSKKLRHMCGLIAKLSGDYS